ncbi:MAG: preprotein translocase subunit SecY [Oscillospiraceae bacterium]|nr:preprotein translocase subunit SecY [Oscillospiraceae bacterium]
MLETMRNAWKIDELRKKILFTLFIVLLYRIGNAVPVPYVDVNTLSTYFDQMSNTVFGLYNVMSGGAFSTATIFALSIQPYINASIIIQLLTIAIPALERLQKEGGEEGKKKLASITRYSTVGLGLVQGFGYYMLMLNQTNNPSGLPILSGTGIWPAIVIVLTLTAGSALIMWLGEQITEFGIGNGISIILFASIVSRFPTQVATMGTSVFNGTLQWWLAVLLLIGALAIIVLIVVVTNAERRIPIQYSKRVVGRKMYGGQSTHLPMKVNMSGVLPVIFAQSITSLLPTILGLAGVTKDSGGFWGGVLTALDMTSPIYAIVYLLLIVFFSYFYSTIQFDPVEISNNLRKNGGFIPGYRPGRPTIDFIRKSLNKITLFGAVYLGIIAVVPLIIGMVSPEASNMGISLGGTSVIIVVGVALETVKALEAQMIMRNYKGFLE